MELVNYNTARNALEKAYRVDEVKQIRDTAIAAQAYAKQAKDTQLINHATEIKIRAEIKCGELLIATAKAKERRDKGNRSVTSDPIPKLIDLGVSKMQSSRWQKLAKLSGEDQEVIISNAKSKMMAAIGDVAEHNHRAQGTGENEWYTPSKYIELARVVLGSISLDPASSAKAQAIIKAKVFFSVQDDGLSKAWNGTVWLNPPYTQPDISNFASKMVSEYRRGKIESAIMLTHNYTDTTWFHELAKAAHAICFTRGRIKFVDAYGNDCAPTQGQAFFYFGKNIEIFTQEFSKAGFV